MVVVLLEWVEWIINLSRSSDYTKKPSAFAGGFFLHVFAFVEMKVKPKIQ